MNRRMVVRIALLLVAVLLAAIPVSADGGPRVVQYSGYVAGYEEMDDTVVLEELPGGRLSIHDPCTIECYHWESSEFGVENVCFAIENWGTAEPSGTTHIWGNAHLVSNTIPGDLTSLSCATYPSTRWQGTFRGTVGPTWKNISVTIDNEGYGGRAGWTMHGEERLHNEIGTIWGQFKPVVSH